MMMASGETRCGETMATGHSQTLRKLQGYHPLRLAHQLSGRITTMTALSILLRQDGMARLRFLRIHERVSLRFGDQRLISDHRKPSVLPHWTSITIAGWIWPLRIGKHLLLRSGGTIAASPLSK